MCSMSLFWQKQNLSTPAEKQRDIPQHIWYIGYTGDTQLSSVVTYVWWKYG